MIIEGLRSPHVRTQDLVYFARMVDKVQLHAEGKLPPDYVENLGEAFDKRCLNFLRISYEPFRLRVLKGGTDEELLEWCYQNGRRPTEEEVEIWNEFMRKRGWNDAGTERLIFRLEEAGYADRTDIQTMFDFIDLDEGRDPAEL